MVRIRARSWFSELYKGNLTLKIKFLLLIFWRSSLKFDLKIKFFLKLYHNLQLKVKFSLAAPKKFEIFCQISSAAPSNRTDAAPTQLQTAAPTRGPAAAPSQLPNAAPPRPTPAAGGCGSAEANERSFRTYVRPTSDVICHMSDKANVICQTYICQTKG